MKANLTKTNQKKFRILEILDLMPHKEAKTLKKKLPEILGVTRQTMAKYCNAQLEDNCDMTTSHFFTLCKILNVEPLELIRLPKNQKPPKKIKDLRENELSKNLGLTK